MLKLEVGDIFTWDQSNQLYRVVGVCKEEGYYDLKWAGYDKVGNFKDEVGTSNYVYKNQLVPPEVITKLRRANNLKTRLQILRDA